MGAFIALLSVVPGINVLLLLTTFGVANILPALLLNVGFATLLISGLRGTVERGWLILAAGWFAIGLGVSLQSRFEIAALHREFLNGNTAARGLTQQRVDGVHVQNSPLFVGGRGNGSGGLLENYPISRLRNDTTMSLLVAGPHCGDEYYRSGLAQRIYNRNFVISPATFGGGQLLKDVCRLSTRAVAELIPNGEVEVQGKRLQYTQGSVGKLDVFRLEVSTPGGSKYALVVGEAVPYPPIPLPMFSTLLCDTGPRKGRETAANVCPVFQPSWLERQLIGVEGGAGDHTARALAYALGLKPVFADHRREEIERATPSISELLKALPKKPEGA
jgi:hypothetical protein